MEIDSASGFDEFLEKFSSLPQILSETSNKPEDIRKIFGIVKEIVEVLHSNPSEGAPDHLQENIISNAFELVESSVDFLSLAYDEKSLTELQKEPDYGLALTKRILVSTLNILDFESPSWHPVNSNHLYYGIEVLAAGNWILRDMPSGGTEAPGDIRMFPQRV